MIENQEEKILKKLRNSNIIPHKIAKATGLSDSTIKNYITGATKPTPANLKILENYFNNSKIENSVIVNNINNSGYIDSRIYDSNSPDVLKAEISKLDSIIADKEDQVRTLTDQVRTLTDQVRTLTSSLAKKDEIIEKLVEKLG
ncbi:MAG: helix-turn-helix domain-containing protein [Bacteroidales bacterium]|nr:helix-turn-helix domain-containing protein [Bacteroidales bacterium]